MPKRVHDGAQEPARASKRLRFGDADHLSLLSDELLLRILSFVSTSTLVLCQRVCKRLNSVAGDSQLWKTAYYNRFVRPRASRLPGIREAKTPSRHLLFSSKSSKWLDEEHLLQYGRTNWKRQYKLRHNWSQGSCAVSEIPISETAPTPPSLVRYCNGIVFTLDSFHGLRAWSSKKPRELLASLDLTSAQTRPVPTSFALDESDSRHDLAQTLHLSIGFADGSFSIYGYLREARQFSLLYHHASSSIGQLSAVALASPYLVTMSESRILSIYKLSKPTGSIPGMELLNAPRLLHSLKSHTAAAPLCLSVRKTGSTVIASVAFTLSTFVSGYSVGIQEMHLSEEGELLQSRSASADDDSFYPLLSALQRTGGPTAGQFNASVPQYDRSFSTPTSLSYTHPYLLVAHPDNTLSLYLVSSTSQKLAISPGSRLWGHTSSVSGAHVGGRGRAVSVSSRGGELRVWELEGGMLSSANRKRLSTGELSVRVRPEADSSVADLSILNAAIAQRGSGLGLALEHIADEQSVTRGWVGFDEENVVVLKEQVEGKQALVVYDFT